MSRPTPAQFYQAEFIDKGYERLDLFKQVADHYAIRSALYPGCFVHVTPAFFFPVTVFVDNDRRAKQFWSDPATRDFIIQKKHYSEDAKVTFHPEDYHAALPEADESFDLLISQYAGFITEPCKRYLKIGALLLVNDSHGDASMASLDADFELTAVVLGNEEQYHLSDQDLETYFAPKTDKIVTREHLTKTGRGVNYKKFASHYLFRRLR